MALHSRQHWAEKDNCILKYHSGNIDFHSELEGGEGQLHAPAPFTPDALRTRGWVGPRAGLDTSEKKKKLCSSRDLKRDSTIICPVT